MGGNLHIYARSCTYIHIFASLCMKLDLVFLELLKLGHARAMTYIPRNGKVYVC